MPPQKLSRQDHVAAGLLPVVGADHLGSVVGKGLYIFYVETRLLELYVADVVGFTSLQIC